MGGLSGGSLGSEGGEGGLPGTFSPQSSLVSSPSGFSVVQGKPREVPRSPGGGQSVDQERGDRGGERQLSRLLQSPVFSNESLGEMETGTGCIASQRLCSQDQVFHGDHPVGPGFHSAGGLDGLHGYARRIFSYSYSPILSEVPKVHIQPKNLPVQGLVLRANDSAPSLHQSVSSPGEDSPPSRLSDIAISGRLAGHREVDSGSAEGKRICVTSSEKVRDFNKFRQIIVDSNPSDRVLGHEDRCQSFLGFSVGQTMSIRGENIKRISCLRRAAGQILAKSVGPSVFIREVHSGFSAEDETPPISPQQMLGQRVSKGSDPGTSGLKTVSNLVVSSSKTVKGVFAPEGEPSPTVVFRRLPRRLGSHHRRNSPIREMVPSRQKAPYQHLGTKGDLVSPQGSDQPSRGEDNCGVRRQHHSPLLHLKTGRDEVLDPIPPSRGDFSLAGGTSGSSSSPVHSGSQKHCGGLTEQAGTSSGHRMDASPRSVQGDLEMVGSTHDRSLCHELNKETAPVLRATLGPDGNRSRRYVTKLVQLGGLCLPSICTNQEGPQQIQTEQELQPDFDSAVVATTGVVPRTNEPSSRTPKGVASSSRSSITTISKNKTQKPPHSSVSRLETIQGLTRHKELSRVVSKAIYDSRKQSTNALYQRRWATYISWCRKRKLSASRPSINSLCEFFIFLFEEKGLAVDTIRCYRSTLHSVLRHTGMKINKNEDIKDVIRSLKLRAPIRNPRIVNWNLDVVLKFLVSEKFEPLNQCSLMNLTKKTFILLTLALSKRVSEMQALSRQVGFCREGALVSLSYDFRAKNYIKCKDLDRHFLVKELGSLVGQEEEALLCPVRALRHYLERTKPLVGQGVSRLFVSPRLPTRQASKNALANMAKDLIREAHVSIQPEMLPVLKVKIHELRGVSTTLAFKKNLSLKTVMEAAQWRCHSVFASHYLKDVELTYEDCRTLGPLLMAGTVIT